MKQPIELGDRVTRKNLVRNLKHYQSGLDAASAQFQDKENAQRQYANRRWRILNSLDAHLLKFEGRFQNDQNKVLWADTVEDCHDAIREILALYPDEKIQLGKGPIIEETQVRPFLKKQNIRTSELFLDQQLLGLSSEESAHPESAVLDKNAAEISSLITNHSSAEDLNSFIDTRRTKTTGSILITAPSQLISKNGSIVLEDEDGALVKQLQKAKAVICLCGMDRIVNNFSSHRLCRETELMFRIGRRSRNYELILDGTDESIRVFVILVNNGRTDLLASKTFRHVLLDLEGASLTYASTLYRHVISNWGSNAYYNAHDNLRESTRKSSPKSGEVFTDLLSNDPSKSLTGMDEEVFELEMRKRFRDKQKQGIGGKVKHRALLKLGLERAFLNSGGFGIKNALYRQIFNREWRKHRVAPRLAKKSFNQLWTSRK